MKKLCLPLCFAAMTAVSGAQIVKKGDAYLLRYQFKKDQEISYVMSGSSTIPGMTDSQSLKVGIRMKVLSVAKGVATIKVVLSSLTNKKEKPTVHNIQMNERGQILKGETGIENSQFLLYPKNPIKPGASWTGNAVGVFPGNASAQLRVQTTFTFKGVQLVNGIQTAVFGATGKSSGGIDFTVASSYAVAPQNGVPSSLASKITGNFPNPNSATPIPFKVNVTFKRQ